MSKALPKKFAWLERETSPKVWAEARRHFGTLEHRGSDNNPNIMGWARELGISGWYTSDAVPWCGLFAAIVVKRAGYQPPANFLGARYFLNFGTAIPLTQAMFADILVFKRPGGHHVGFYIGESHDYYLVYGGNQSDAVGFAWLAKSRLIGVRRCPWKVGQPVNVRKIYLTLDGLPSKNES